MGSRTVKNSLAALTWVGAGTGLACLSGCAGGVPLLHPVHALAPGRTAFAVGASNRFVLGDAQHALNDTEQLTPGTPPEKAARGALVRLAEGPAVAAFAAARIGIPGTNEAGLSYSGHALRGDLRHAFEWGHSALSAGLGLTGHFGQSTAHLPPGADLSGTRGVGVDLPLLLGYRSDADLISVWGGLRGSFDRWSGTVSLDSTPAYELEASRMALGPIVGLSLGLPPFWVSAELELDYAHVAGSLDRPGLRHDAQLSGWSARPAGALVAKF
ncbi:MAG TPA: hypothetical protein VJV79_20220 [Polyangiaceae bacterium]|nr:hypothetical protein [Polyangiaceae bacterium]